MNVYVMKPNAVGGTISRIINRSMTPKIFTRVASGIDV